MLAEFEVALASLADGGHALDYTVKHWITLSSSAGSAYAFYALPSTSLPSISQRPFPDANSNQVQVW